MSANELIKADACTVVDRLKRGEATPHDLLDALEDRIAALSPLAGLPVPIKDLTDVADVRTTYGSPVYPHHVPGRSDLLMERVVGIYFELFPISSIKPERAYY